MDHCIMFIVYCQCFFFLLGEGFTAQGKEDQFVPTVPLLLPRVIPHRSCWNLAGSAITNWLQIFSLIAVLSYRYMIVSKILLPYLLRYMSRMELPLREYFNFSIVSLFPQQISRHFKTTLLEYLWIENWGNRSRIISVILTHRQKPKNSQQNCTTQLPQQSWITRSIFIAVAFKNFLTISSAQLLGRLLKPASCMSLSLFIICLRTHIAFLFSANLTKFYAAKWKQGRVYLAGMIFMIFCMKCVAFECSDNSQRSFLAVYTRRQCSSSCVSKATKVCNVWVPCLFFTSIGMLPVNFCKMNMRCWVLQMVKSFCIMQLAYQWVTSSQKSGESVLKISLSQSFVTSVRQAWKFLDWMLFFTYSLNFPDEISLERSTFYFQNDLQLTSLRQALFLYWSQQLDDLMVDVYGLFQLSNSVMLEFYRLHIY